MPFRFNPFTNNLDIVDTATIPVTVATQFDADSGSAIPASNILNIVGDSVISTSGAGSTVTISIQDASTSVKGAIEIATDAETIAGASSTLASTPSGVDAKLGTQTSNAIPVGAGSSSALSWIGPGSDGELIIGATGASPSFAGLTSSDASVTITNGPGSIDLKAASGGNVSAGASLTDNAVVRGDGGGTDVQTSTLFVDDNGLMTNANQCAFLAYLPSVANNVTGDNTVYYLGDTDTGPSLSEFFDNNSDFTPGASGGAYFTAPVDGTYQFNFNILMKGCTGRDYLGVQLFATSRTYVFSNYTFDDGLDYTGIGYAALVPMDEGDTITMGISLSGGTKVSDVYGASIPRTMWSGFLVC